MIRIEEMSVRLGIPFCFQTGRRVGRMAAGEPAAMSSDYACGHKKRARGRASWSPTRTRAQARRGARSLTQIRRGGKGRAVGAALSGGNGWNNPFGGSIVQELMG